MKKITRHLTLIVLAIFMLTTAVSAVSVNNSTDKISVNASSNQITVPIDIDESTAYSGMEFQVTVTGGVSLSSFQLASGLSGATSIPISEARGSYFFGFLSSSNSFSGVAKVNMIFSVTGDGTIAVDTIKQAAIDSNNRTNSTIIAQDISINITKATSTGGGSSGGGTSSPTFSFTDVLESHWFYNDVKTAYEKGLINGKTATTFCPDEEMTYAEAIKLAACMNQMYLNGKVTLKNGSINWYSTYVEYAKERGIITKIYEDYDANISRAEYVDIFSRALPDSALAAINTIADDSIPDVKMVNSYSAPIYKLYRAGILRGNDEFGTFRPDDSIKRSEVSAVLTRMMDNTARLSFTLG